MLIMYNTNTLLKYKCESQRLTLFLCHIFKGGSTVSKKERQVATNQSKQTQDKEEHTIRFTDKERKAEDVAKKQTRGGFE